MAGKISIRKIYEKSSLQKYISGRFTLLKLTYLSLRRVLFLNKKSFLELQNRYRGRNVYLVATGPSLSVEDLNMIYEHDGISMSVNKIFRIFPKTKWRPNIYFVSDNELVKDYGEELKLLKRHVCPIVIYNGIYMDKFRKDAVPYKTNTVSGVLKGSKSQFWRSQYKGCEFSTNARIYVNDGSSCIISAIQIAYYLGFSKVFLLGVDCGPSIEGDAYSADIGIKQRTDNCSFEEMLYDFECLSKSMKKKKIKMKVYNCTRGGRLEAFPRMKLEETFE